MQIFFGGNISVYTKLAEQARQEAYDLLVEHAHASGRQRHPGFAL